MSTIHTVMVTCLTVFLANAVVAQEPSPRDETQPVAGQPVAGQPVAGQSAQTPAGVISNPAGSTVGDYPPYPLLFHRGSHKPNADTLTLPRYGWYLSLTKVGLYIFLLWFWVWSSQWVNTDSTALKVRSEFWNALMMGCGGAGLACSVGIPSFALAFLAVGASTGTPLGLYIRERNSIVPENSRVLTPQHIRSVIIRKLALIGIHIGGKGADTESVGPDIRFIGRDATGNLDESRARQVENSSGFMAAKELVYDALIRRATDIHLEPRENAMNVRMRIDGVMYPVEPFDRALGNAVINIFKNLGAMDITEKRRSLDGSFRAISEGRDIDFRVATQGTRGGEKLSLRILDQSQGIGSMKDLGFRKKLETQLLNIAHQPHGMMLVCGPTGAGKSTTLYSCLKTIDVYQQNIITVEDPVEYHMDNITQIEINQKAGQDFAKSLRSILRQDPDVIMIGEIRDGETAEIACSAANTGHMVFSTVHANDSITALYRMLDLGVEPFLFASAVSGILAQRLARRLCAKCKVPYRPKPEFLKQASLPVDRIEKFYRPPRNPAEECPSCGGLGYRGRVGVFEFLEVNEKLREMVREKVGVQQLKSEARKNGMLYMQEEGLRLVVKGLTSIDELLRVVK